MRGRQALGGRRLIGVFALPLIVTALVSVPGVGPASPAPQLREPIDDPMDAIVLPICPDQLNTSTAIPSVWANHDGVDRFEPRQELGLEQNCANQNWPDPENPTTSFPRASVVVADPNTVPINDDPQTITFRATNGEIPGPYNLYTDDCFPASGRAGGCASTFLVNVAYRVANGSGTFSGPWTRVYDSGDNPYFDFTLTDCPDNYPAWTPADQHIGMPCEVELIFATNVSGAPVLTSAMQVVMSLNLMSGTDGTSYEHSTLLAVPMLFTPGASVSLSLASLPSKVAYDTKLNLRANTLGPPQGSTISFYRRTSGGAWSWIGADNTDAEGDASLLTTAKSSAQYMARITVGGNETFESPVRAVSVTRDLALKAKKPKNGKVKFKATLEPGASPGTVKLQRKKGSRWKTIETSPVGGKVKWKVKVPDGKSTWRVMTSTTPGFAGSISKSVKVKLE